jgi:hypothetical protein
MERQCGAPPGAPPRTDRHGIPVWEHRDAFDAFAGAFADSESLKGAWWRSGHDALHRTTTPDAVRAAGANLDRRAREAYSRPLPLLRRSLAA